MSDAFAESIMMGLFIGLLILLVTTGNSEWRTTETVPVEDNTTCFDTSNMSDDYKMYCYNIDKVNLTIDEHGNIDKKVIGSKYVEKPD